MNAPSPKNKLFELIEHSNTAPLIKQAIDINMPFLTLSAPVTKGLLLVRFINASCFISSNWFTPFEAAVIKNPPISNCSATTFDDPPTNKYPDKAEITTKKERRNFVN